MHAHGASAWVGCAPGESEHDPGRVGREATDLLPAPLPRTWGHGEAEILRSAAGFGGPGGRGTRAGAAPPWWDHLCSPRLARRRYFSAPRRAPAPRARLVLFHSPGGGQSGASRDPAGRALRVLTRRLYLRPQAGRQAGGGRTDAGGAPRRTKGVQCCSKHRIPPGAQHEESRSGQVQYFPG